MRVNKSLGTVLALLLASQISYADTIISVPSSQIINQPVSSGCFTGSASVADPTNQWYTAVNISVKNICSSPQDLNGVSVSFPSNSQGLMNFWNPWPFGSGNPQYSNGVAKYVIVNQSQDAYNTTMMKPQQTIVLQTGANLSGSPLKLGAVTVGGGSGPVSNNGEIDVAINPSGVNGYSQATVISINSSALSSPVNINFNNWQGGQQIYRIIGLPYGSYTVSAPALGSSYTGSASPSNFNVSSSSPQLVNVSYKAVPATGNLKVTLPQAPLTNIGSSAVVQIQSSQGQILSQSINWNQSYTFMGLPAGNVYSVSTGNLTNGKMLATPNAIAPQTISKGVTSAVNISYQTKAQSTQAVTVHFSGLSSDSASLSLVDGYQNNYGPFNNVGSKDYVLDLPINNSYKLTAAAEGYTSSVNPSSFTVPGTSSINVAFTAVPVQAGLTYDYQVTGGGSQILLYNHSNSPISVNKMNFAMNSNVNAFWGTLWAYNSSKVITKVANGWDYQLTINPAVNIPANGYVSLAFGSPSAYYGPLPIAMPPYSVNVNGANVDVEGKCQGAKCVSPIANGRINMGYYTDWDMYQRAYPATSIPVDKINMIAYAFVNYDTAGNVFSWDSWSDSLQMPVISMLRKKYPYLNVSLSFGGWTLSDNFGPLTKNTTAMNNFVNNAVAAMQESGYNGIDIDWEYPVVGGLNPKYPAALEEASNFAKLLTALRVKLDALSAQTGEKYYLTIAAPAGIDKITAIQNADPQAWAQVAKAVDYVNIMTYDFHGSWDEKTNFQAPMAIDPVLDPSKNTYPGNKYTVIEAVNAYLALGFKPAQIVLGMPIYGRMSSINGAGSYKGLYQPITGTPNGQYDNTGMFDYNCIMGQCKGNSLPAGMTFVSSSDALGQYSHEPWGYSNQYFITYDDAPTVTYKTQWAVSQGLGGVMFWSLSGDLPASDQKSLINASFKALNGQ